MENFTSRVSRDVARLTCAFSQASRNLDRFLIAFAVIINSGLSRQT